MKNEKNNERKMDKYEVVKEEVKWYREKNKHNGGNRKFRLFRIYIQHVDCI